MAGRQAGQPALCIHLRPVFCLTPLNSDLYAIFSNELNTSTNKILHSLLTILHFGEDFLNLSRTQYSTMSTQLGCTNVDATHPLLRESSRP